MPAPARRSSLPAATLSAGLLCLAACTSPDVTAAAPVAEVAPKFSPAYQTSPASLTVDASARVETSVALDPALRPLWETWLGKGPNIDAYLTAMAGTVTSDVANSGLFARIEQADDAKPDYLVKIQAVESDPMNLRLKVTIQLVELATGVELFSRTAELAVGLNAGRNHSISFSQPPKYAPDMNGGWSGTRMLMGSMQQAFEQVMPVMKAGVAGHFQKIADQKTLEQMQAAGLLELVSGTDRSASLARERNRLIVVAKNRQLSAILREMKPAELTDLATKLELAILDLGHESELAKERAQQTAPSQGEELRGLALGYRERIDLLKPILAAVQERIGRP